MSQTNYDELTSELALIEARRLQIRRILLKESKDRPIYSNGFWAGRVQTIRQEIPSPIRVAQCLPNLINDNQWPEYLTHFLNRISIVSWPGAVKSLPVAAELLAMLSESDGDGGMIEVIGKPASVICKYIPNTGKREGTQHIVTADDPPLAAKPFTSTEDEGEYTDDGPETPGD